MTERSWSTDDVVGVLADEFVELASVEYEGVVSWMQNAALGRDRPRRVHVVSGHHAHRDPRALALANCIRHLPDHPHTGVL